jgi:GTP-binding protein
MQGVIFLKITSVDLKISAVRRSQYPTDERPEYLLVGRSNVGKSSFINTLMNRKNYARTSATPGKTQTINFYLVNEDFYLVDAPGYGYAMLSKKRQKKFGLMMEDYIQNRPNLKQVFMLIDFRHKPTSDDVMMYNFLKYYRIPTTIVATKADKLSTNERNKSLKILKETLDIVVGDNLTIFSSVTKEGKEEIIKVLEDNIA